jgi:hypothetical protein
VTRCVKYLQGPRSPNQAVAFSQKLVHIDCVGWPDAEPRRLRCQILVQGQISLVHHHRRATGARQLLDAADVIDVSVGRDDVFGLQAVPREDLLHTLDIVARIDDDGIAGGFIAQHVAIALQHSNWHHFLDHDCIIAETGLTNDVASSCLNIISVYAIVALPCGRDLYLPPSFWQSALSL